jgi:hypothetical protein
VATGLPGGPFIGCPIPVPGRGNPPPGTCPRSVALFPDLDGDRKADYLVVQTAGQELASFNHGGDGHGGWQDRGFPMVSNQLITTN